MIIFAFYDISFNFLEGECLAYQIRKMLSYSDVFSMTHMTRRQSEINGPVCICLTVRPQLEVYSALHMLKKLRY